MIVVTVSSCPSRLRGDLTKWFFEIDTGVFVGNLSARVRDAVWERICENIGSGRAAMVFSCNGEQKLDFRIHNSDWEPKDYDGIKLTYRRIDNGVSKDRADTTPNALKFHVMRTMQRSKKSVNDLNDYVVIDIETTGLDFASDRIIEIGALSVKNGEIESEFSVLLKTDVPLPEKIIGLTGITDEMLSEHGRDEAEALKEFKEFCGERELVGHNAALFDMNFLREAFLRNGLSMMENKVNDTLRMSRRRIDCPNHELSDIAKYLDIEYDTLHRALNDCRLTHKVFEKLKRV